MESEEDEIADDAPLDIDKQELVRKDKETVENWNNLI